MEQVFKLGKKGKYDELIRLNGGRNKSVEVVVWYRRWRSEKGNYEKLKVKR